MKNRFNITFFLLIFALCLGCQSFAQIGINTDGSDPDSSAILDVKSTDKGLLIPRMNSASRMAIVTPAEGLMVYDSTTNSFWFYQNTAWTELLSGQQATISDADSDTKIQVEESNDEDIIRFDLGGTEFMRLDSGRMEIVNTGGSIFLGEGAGENDDFSNNRNVFVGIEAGKENDAGYNNTFIGGYAGKDNGIAYNNTFIGTYSGFVNTFGDENTFVGSYSGYDNTTGVANVFLGNYSGYHNTIGNLNTFIGRSTGYNNTTGEKNTYLGTYSGSSNTTGSGNLFLGYSAGFNETGSNKLYIANSNTATPLIYGDFDSDSLQINGILNINGAFNLPTTDGTASQVLATDGNGTLSWTDAFGGSYTFPNSDGTALQILATDGNGTLSWTDASTLTPVVDSTLLSDTDADTKIQVEESADEDIIRFDIGGVEYFRIEKNRLETRNTGNSVFIGEEAGENDDLSNNVNINIGYQAGKSNESTTNNIAIGAQALDVQTSGGFNTVVGTLAATSATDFKWNVVMGNAAMTNTESGNGSTAIGSFSLFDNSGNYNTALGYETNSYSSSAAQTTAIGAFALQQNTGTGHNVAIGYQAGKTSGTSTGCVYIGRNAGFSNTTSNRLFIENSNSATPLIYGEFDNDLVRINGELQVIENLYFQDDEGTSNWLANGSGDEFWINDQSQGGSTTPFRIEGGASSNALVLADNGNVGIGTQDPVKAKLEVEGFDAHSVNNYAFYNNTGYTHDITGPFELDFSIYADSRIAGFSFVAHSDERIKNIKGKSDNAADLHTLMDIEITDYQMVDSLQYGNTLHKKVIAQQVAKVFPQAVTNNTTEIVPDIFQTATMDKNGWVTLETLNLNVSNPIKKGDKIKIIFEQGEALLKVIETNKNSFRVDVETLKFNVSTDDTPENIFVYGKQVNDFHTVDYEAISMLNVSATQQLAKENTALKEKVKQQNQRINNLEEQATKVTQLELMLLELKAQLSENHQQ